MGPHRLFIRYYCKVPSVLEEYGGCTTYREARTGVWPTWFGSMTGRANGAYLPSSADGIMVLEDGENKISKLP
jgi:hypothetical protein